MNIDIKKTVIKIQFRRFIIFLVFASLAIATVFPIWGEEILGFKRIYWTILFALLYGLYILYEMLMDYNYIQFTLSKDEIVLRFFSLGLFNKKKQVIQIPVKEFKGYDVQTSFFGKVKKVVLKRAYKDKVARYPAISFSALHPDQEKLIFIKLDELS